MSPQQGAVIQFRPRRDVAPRHTAAGQHEKFGGVLLSQEESLQVPLALAGLTSVFGLGTGVTLPLWPPKSLDSHPANPDGVRYVEFVEPQQLHSEHKHNDKSKPSAD